MTALHARSALLPDGWCANVRLSFEAGRISGVERDATAAPDDDRRSVVVAAMPNLHSHAFQRAMAGLAERRGLAADSFWSWRAVMYRFALAMTPDQMEAVAAQLYVEMLEAGFGRVGEFHYLHNDRDGSLYANVAEMAERVASASAEAGIGLTLLPAFYAHSGFGGQAPAAGQRRFIQSPAGFERLMDACRPIVSGLPGAVLGVAPHSLRAVTPPELAAAIGLAPDGPVHIHVAEQTQEVEDCLAATGRRPVDWLLDHAPVDERWCLVHATHMTADETGRLAASGATVGLCPITEANLGDGVFEAARFLEAGGRFGIGSDSNVLIALPEELRMLEYGQRLTLRARNVIADSGGSTGRKLFDQALLGGNAALGARVGLAPGKDADIVALDMGAADHSRGDDLLDRWIFAGGARVDAVWVRGVRKVDGGRHVDRERIEPRFRRAMRDLLDT